MINLLFRSASIFHPSCQKTVLTDRHTDLSGLNKDIRTKRFDIDPSKTIFSRMTAEMDYVKSHDFSSDLILLDSDMLVNDDLKTLEDKDFDVALTYRSQDQLPFKKKELAINGGVIFLKKGRKIEAIEFLERVFAVFKTKYNTEKLWWWGEQYALIEIVGQNNIPREGSSVVTLGKTKVLLLPCDDYNFSPLPEYRSIRSELPGKKILHFKGKRKKLMPLYWSLYLRRREKQSLGTAAQAAMSRATLVTLRLLDSLKPKKVDPHCSHNNALLTKLIKNQRVLILGSGPSASELSSIPEDVKVFTCNASPKLLLDKKIVREIDLLFFIKSKVSKSLLIDGLPVEKTKAIEELLCRSKIKLVVTNKPEHAQRLKNSKRLDFTCLFDDGRDPYYLNHLLQPNSVESIRGSSPLPWTSTAIRLLQYALFYGAKEIYVVGIDFGDGGYFWGPNPNEWRHPDIDENFVKIIALKYDNMYSLSRSSPMTKYIKYKASF